MSNLVRKYSGILFWLALSVVAWFFYNLINNQETSAMTGMALVALIVTLGYGAFAVLSGGKKEGSVENVAGRQVSCNVGKNQIVILGHIAEATDTPPFFRKIVSQLPVATENSSGIVSISSAVNFCLLRTEGRHYLNSALTEIFGVVSTTAKENTFSDLTAKKEGGKDYLITAKVGTVIETICDDCVILYASKIKSDADHEKAVKAIISAAVTDAVRLHGGDQALVRSHMFDVVDNKLKHYGLKLVRLDLEIKEKPEPPKMEIKTEPVDYGGGKKGKRR